MRPAYLETIAAGRRTFVALRDPLRCLHRVVVTDPLAPSVERAREELE
jgi:hypothetical protein